MIHKKEGQDQYYLPFLGSDESVVYRSQRYMYQWEQKRPVQFKAYFKAGSFFQTCMAIIAAMFLFIMVKMSFTRNLILKYPKFFTMGLVTKEGPTDIVMNNSQFTFDLVGEGWEEGTETEGKPNKRVVATVCIIFNVLFLMFLVLIALFICFSLIKVFPCEMFVLYSFQKDLGRLVWEFCTARHISW